MPDTLALTPSPALGPESVWATHYATSAGFRYWPCEELVRSLSGRRFGTVLEAGCGNGANLWLLAEHADTVVGVDSEPAALSVASEYMTRRGVRNRVALRTGDVAALPADDASVDAVVDVMVSQHARWGEHRARYAEYRRVLRPKGWLFLYHLAMGTSTGPEPTQVDAFTYERLSLFPDAGQICLPPRWALQDAMADAGFVVTTSRAATRHYADGQMAVYHVLEGETR